jgi:hypothetical protein
MTMTLRPLQISDDCLCLLVHQGLQPFIGLLSHFQGDYRGLLPADASSKKIVLLVPLLFSRIYTHPFNYDMLHISCGEATGLLCETTKMSFSQDMFLAT